MVAGERSGMAKRKRRYLLALLLLLVLGLGMMLAYAARKQGYHVDELYTYELTNYPGGFYALQDGYMTPGRMGPSTKAPCSPAVPLTIRCPGTTRRSTCTRPCITARCTRRNRFFRGWGCPG